MSNLLQSKNVAITGATTGIGRAMAIGLAQQGANIATVYLASEKENADSLGDEIRKIRGESSFVAIEGDVSLQETSARLVEACVSAFGELNVLVANAGICVYRDFLTAPAEFYYRTIKVNQDGVYFAIQEAGKQMQKQGKGGSIIATGSIRSLLGGAQLVPYTASKGAVLSIVQAAAAALGPMGIRVNCILPGTIVTPISEKELTDPELIARIIKRIPMGRFGRPEDLVGPVTFLASDMSAYLNGSEMLVDGGLYINLE